MKLCSAWAEGTVEKDDIITAADSTLAEVKTIELAAGIEDDPNLASNDEETYAALCLIKGEVANTLGGSRALLYQLENGGGIFIAKL